jgi:hypothetical protein
MEQRQNSSISIRLIGVKYGMILALISIVYFIVLDLLDIDITQGVGRWANMIFNFGILFWAHIFFKGTNKGYMSYSEGFRIGFWIALVAPLVSGVFTYVYIKFIDTSFISKMHDRARESIQARGILTEDQIDHAMLVNAKFLTPEYLLILSLIGGVILMLTATALITLLTWKPYKKIKSPDLMS